MTQAQVTTAQLQQFMLQLYRNHSCFICCCSPCRSLPIITLRMLNNITMFDRSKERKEPKAVRHDVAQQKCKIYQRSQSSKLRPNQSATLLPSTGQFVLSNPKQLKITSNIQQIVRDPHPESASQLLSLNASRRNSISKEEGMDRARVQKEGPPKNSYLVKSRVPTPKFAQGYRIVKLDNQPKLKIAKEPSVREELEAEGEGKEDAQFLPVEYYLLEEEQPRALMERHRIGESSYVLGYSRWYDLAGNCHWKKCRVVGFLEEVQRWEIEWLHNNRRKEVSRINLNFEGESRAAFERRVAQAHKYRRLSEVYYRYNNDIDELHTPTNQLTQDKLAAILAHLKQGHFAANKVSKLTEEVKETFIRANHQAEFNASLPFDPKKRRQYEQYLPVCLFQPGQQYKLRYNISPAPLLSPSSAAYFQAAKLQFKQRTSLKVTHRLHIIEYLNRFEERMQGESFVGWKSDRAYCLEEVLRAGNEKTGELLRELNHAICDIEHHIGHELDTLYLEKRVREEEFNKATEGYVGFLSMVTLRLESAVRGVLLNTIRKLTAAFTPQQDEQLSIQIVLHKRDAAVYYQVLPEQIKERLVAFVRGVMKELQTIPCPSKSYLRQDRHWNLMNIVFQNTIDYSNQPFQVIKEELQSFTAVLNTNCSKLTDFSNQIQTIVEQFAIITSEVKKQVQKRYGFPEIAALNSQMRSLEGSAAGVWRLREGEGRMRVGSFVLRIEQVMVRMRRNFQETRRELYRLVLEKILKENEKIEKMIAGLEERLERPPTNIIEMLALQKLVREEATEELERIYGRIREVGAKVCVLEEVGEVEYRDFQACQRVWVMPGRLKGEVVRVRRELESTYRRRFGEELNKDAGRVLQATRVCSDQLLSCLRIDSLDEMCDKFMLFSNLNERLAVGIKEAELINEREEAMTWARTDFSKLFQLKEEFAPHFSLISYAKNYQVHLELLSTGPFTHIDFPRLDQELTAAAAELAAIREVFTRNPKMSRITSQIQEKYAGYAEHLPLIRCLRNPDLRQRHWSIIRDILAADPQADTTSLRLLLNHGAQLHLPQLEEISSIASRELLFEKRLIRLKRDWKEVRVVLGVGVAGAGEEGLRTVANLRQLRQRLEADIFQVQEILSASFIKFLEAEIICWRNQVLYKAHELIEKWEKVQGEVCLVAAIFGKPRARNELQGEFIRFQILEKAWRGLCGMVQSQPGLAEVLQSKAYDSLTAMETSIERIKKQLFSFFEDKKREYARLGCISDDQFINLLSCDETDPRENAVFEQTVRKCFQNIRTLVRNERHEIVKIRTRSNEEIPLTQMSYVERLVEYILPNELIVQLERKIQRELKSSLESVANYPHNHITQVLLLYQRLNFTIALEEEITKNHCVSAAFLREAELYRDDLVALLLDSSPTHKNQCELLQALYHLQVATTLWEHSYMDPSSFAWLSQPRTYLRNQQYCVEVGLLAEPYGFEIVDLDNIITEEWSARIFCSYAGVIRERGFCLVEAGCTVGKTASVRKLAALFGHKEFIVDSHPLVSARNLLEYMRMAAAGMWVVLRNLQRLTQPQFSLLARNLEVTWVHHLLQPRQPFSIQGTGVTFKAQNLKVFATIDDNLGRLGGGVAALAEGVKRHFRVIYLPRINAEYVVEVKTLVLGLEGVRAGRVCAIIAYLKHQLAFDSALQVVFSDIYLLNKLFALVGPQRKGRHEDCLDAAFLELVDELAREEGVRERVKKCLSDIFRIRGTGRAGEEAEAYKQEFVQLRRFYNQNLLHVYQRLCESLGTHNFILLVGPADSGKSSLFSMLLQQQRADLACLCPNAYHIDDLYGNDFSNGVVCSLIEETLKRIKRDGSRRSGILFDGEMSMWMEPLAGVVSSGHIIQPNGNTLLIQEELKFVFQCKSLAGVPPSLVLYAAVLVLNEPIKWQNLFTHHLSTKFSEKYQLPMLIKYLELFMPYIVDPIIEFYETTCSEYRTGKNHCYVPPNPIILSLLSLYEALLDHHFHSAILALSEKVCSDIFNLFVLAVVWTVGAILPQESRKSFTRHFKYLIKRAVQVNIQGVTKESLPEDDHDLFKVNYFKDRWVYWNDTMILPDRLPHPISRLFLQRPEDMGVSFIMERYLQRSLPVYVVGEGVGVLEWIVGRLNTEVFNVRRLNFNPNSQVGLLKEVVLREMSKEKYSSQFHGFVHGKKTLIAIRDLNLPLIKHQDSFRVGLLEFIRHYYVTSGWYLRDLAQHYSFKNIVFCGTLSLARPLPANLQKYSNLIFRPAHRDDLALHATLLLERSPIAEHAPALVPLITNLHHAVCRELASLSIVAIEKSDAMAIAEGLVHMGGADKLEVFRRWMFMSEKVYQEKLLSEQAERLFYLVNNVLMEEEKIRYKSIRPNPALFETYFATNIALYHNMKTLRKEVEERCSSIISGESDLRQKRARRKESKIQEFASELDYRASEFMNHLAESKHKSANLKDDFLRVIVQLVNTFHLQSPYVLALHVPAPLAFSPLDLQECLEIVAVVREAKLLFLRLDDDQWNNSYERGTWKDIMMGIIEEILSSMERGQDLQEVIVLLDGFTSQNDYIIDDLMDMKRVPHLPFRIDVATMLEYFLDNFKQLNKVKREENAEEFYGIESKAKLKEKKYQLERKEREKNLLKLEASIIAKLKFVINITEESIESAKKSKLFEQYAGALCEFSFLNLTIYSPMEGTAKHREWKADSFQPSLGDIRSKTLITDFNKEESEEESEVADEAKEVELHLKEQEESILDHLIEKMTFKNCFSADEQWLRGKNNNLRQLYACVKERLGKLCHQNMETVSKRIERVMNIQQLSSLVNHKMEQIQQKAASFEDQQKKIKQQKHERQFDYEQAMLHNKNSEMAIANLKKEREEYEIIHQKLVCSSRNLFLSEREAFIETIKQCRERKLASMNHILRVFFEALGILIEKKLKKEEEMHKEIMRELFNHIGNAKIVKRVSGLCSQGLYNISERISLKVKELFVDIEKEKHERRYREDPDKQQSLLDRLIKSFTSFFARLIEFFHTSQQKQVKECLRRLSENERATDKHRDTQNKNLKSKQYLSILERYEEIRLKESDFQQSKEKAKTLRRVCEFLKIRLSNFQALKYTENRRCSLKCQDHPSCSFLCTITENLMVIKDKILEIQEDIESYALTIAIRLYYVIDHSQNDIVGILSDFQKYRTSQKGYNTMDYIPSKLANLSIIDNIVNGAVVDPNEHDLDKRLQNKKKKEYISIKYFESENIVSLLQFTPGIIMLGVEKGSLDLGNSMGGAHLENGGIKDLFESFIINTGQITKWMRTRNEQSYHKVCLSSRVALENKSFAKSVKSIIIEDEQESIEKRLCVMIVQSREELKSLLKIIRRQPISRDLTILIITDIQHVGLEEGIYSISFRQEDMRQFGKKIDKLLNNFGDKAESQFISQLNDIEEKKKDFKTSVEFSLDLQDEMLIQSVSRSLQNETQQLLQEYVLAIKKAEIVVKQSEKMQKSKQEHKKPQFETLLQWISKIYVLLDGNCELLKLEENLLKQTEKRKFSNLNDRISKYIVRLIELIMQFQRNSRLPKMLSTTKYLQILTAILQKNKELNKKGNILKLQSEFKLLIWNYIASLYPAHFYVMLLIFLAAEQEVPYSHTKLVALLQLSLENVEEGEQELRIIKDSNKMLDLYIAPKQDADSHESIQQSSEDGHNQGQEVFQVTNKLKRKLKKLKMVMKSLQIQESIENNVSEWYAFLSTLSKSSSNIPQTLLIQCNNIFVLFYFLTLVHPTLYPSWLEEIDSEDYHKNLNKTETVSHSKRSEIRLYQASYHSEWKELTTILFYQFLALGNRNLLLINVDAINLIEICVHHKVSYVYLDFTTVFWQINKALELKHIEQRQLANYNQYPNQSSREPMKYSKAYDQILETLKSSLKNETWIIINLNYYRILNVTMHEYFKKINDLISSIMGPQPPQKAHQEQHRISYVNASMKSDTKQYRSMIIYLADFETASLDEDMTIHQNENRSKQQIINSFLHMHQSFIYVLRTTKPQTSQRLYKTIKQFKKQYFFALVKSPKNRKEYEKLTLSQKAILYQFILISHNILEDYAIRNENAEESLDNQYFQQLISRVYGCAGIMKDICVTTDKQQELLFNYQQKSKKQAPKAEDIQNILFKIEQFVILLVQYTFQLNFQSNLLGKRVHCTLQYVVEIKKYCQNIKNLHLDIIINQINQQSKSQKLDIDIVPVFSLTNHLSQKLSAFHSQGLQLSIDQIQKQTSFKQQQQKLLQIFIQQSKLSFTQKMKEISSFSHEQYDMIKSIVQRLRLYDTKKLSEQYKALSQVIQSTAQDLQSKYARLVGKSKHKGTFTQNQNANTVITNAITQLFNRETVSGEEFDQRWEVNQLEQIFLRILIILKRKILSFGSFLQSIRDIIKEYVQIQFHSTVHLDCQQISEVSEDEEENTRKSQEQQIKLMIKKKIQTKVLVERLLKKISSLYKQLSCNATKSKNFSFQQEKVIYEAIRLAENSYSALRQKINQCSNNYIVFQKQHKDKLVKLQDSLYSEFPLSQFIFNFEQHQLAKIIEIMKIIHAKRYHQQFHMLRHSLQLVCAKGQSQPYRTILYFQNFKMFNARYEIGNNLIMVEADHGSSVECGDLYIQVTIQEEYDIESQESEQDLGGYTWFRCPFYSRNDIKKSQTRQRVDILIKEIMEFTLRKQNIYMSY